MPWVRYVLLSVLCAAGLGLACAGAGKSYFSAYAALEVGDFENIEAIGEAGGIRPPAVVLAAAKRDIVQRVLELHLFRRVGEHEDGRAKSEGKGTVLLSCTVEVFDSKVNKGGGKGTLKLSIKMVDQETKTLLFDGKVSAKISAWVNRPNSEVTATEIGKQVAKLIKENW